MLFVLAGVLHIFYNWRPIIVYLRNRAKDVSSFTAPFGPSLSIKEIGSRNDKEPMEIFEAIRTLVVDR